LLSEEIISRLSELDSVKDKETFTIANYLLYESSHIKRPTIARKKYCDASLTPYLEEISPSLKSYCETYNVSNKYYSASTHLNCADNSIVSSWFKEK
jgi:hypothetical protein